MTNHEEHERHEGHERDQRYSVTVVIFATYVVKGME